MCCLKAPPKTHSLSSLDGQQPASLLASSQPAVLASVSSETQDSAFPFQ